MNARNHFACLAALCFSITGIADTTIADDHHHHDNHEKAAQSSTPAPTAPASNQAYQDTCGACHLAYQPYLLPSRSWENILAGLDDHFGQAVEADPESKRTIADYLNTQAADKSSARLGGRIMKSLGSATPLKITETPYIQRQHHEISSKTLQRESIGSLSNCSACHTTAEKGNYNDDSVKIPRQ